MAGSRKLANLPGIDEGPEVYQLVGDTDTTTIQGDPGSSIDASSEDSDEDESGIQKQRLNPNAARSQFSSSRVDASKANFSDQVGRHKRSYYVSREDGEEDEEDLDPEQRLKRHNLSRRIVQMQQLLEDLKNDIEAAKETGEWKETSQEEEDKQDDEALVKISESLRQITMTDRGADSATTRMQRRAAMVREPGAPRLPSEDAAAEHPPISSQAKSFSHISDSQAIAVYSKFSTRLEKLENLLGLDSMFSPDMPSGKDIPMPLLKMTDVMAKQLNLLTDAEDPYLDQLGKRIRTLTADADRMEEKRKEARKGYEDLISARDASSTGFSLTNGYPITPLSPTLSGTTRRPGIEDGRQSAMSLDPDNPLVDPELPGKIAALHSTLPAIERLAPQLHPTLERLRALREVHQDAASAETRLVALERHEVEIQKQIKEWRSALVGLEEQTNELEEEWLENMQNVEKKVKDLESRMQAL